MSNTFSVALTFKISDYTQSMLDNLEGYEDYAVEEIAQLFQDFVERELKCQGKTVERFIQDVCIQTNESMLEMIG
jgi:hypothetical protein